MIVVRSGWPSTGPQQMANTAGGIGRNGMAVVKVTAESCNFVTCAVGANHLYPTYPESLLILADSRQPTLQTSKPTQGWSSLAEYRIRLYDTPSTTTVGTCCGEQEQTHFSRQIFKLIAMHVAYFTLIYGGATRIKEGRGRCRLPTHTPRMTEKSISSLSVNRWLP